MRALTRIRLPGTGCMTTASTIRSGVEKLISFHDVHKVYADGTVAIDRLNLEVPEGTLTVFVGPSGCGKTTSMRMINRMAEPTSGTVVVDGADIAGVDPVRLRLGIGYVIQGGGLMPHQRVIDNVATVPVLKGQSRRAARKAAYTVLERVGLDAKLAGRYPAQLSGGVQLQREILRLQAELHKTIVFVTHDVDEAFRLADRVAVFGRGGVLQQYDEPAHLLSRPANDFVARMIGAGRGYRWLQFLDATSLPIHDIPTITDPAAVGEAQLRDGWALVVKPDGTPLGWIDAGGVRKHRGGASLHDSVTSVGSVFRPDANLSQALDAALSSPAAMGVAVDKAGKVTGAVRAADVLAALDSRRRN